MDGYGMNNNLNNNDNNEPKNTETGGSSTEISTGTSSGGLYSSRHYEYSSGENRASYTTGTSAQGTGSTEDSPYYSRPSGRTYHSSYDESSKYGTGFGEDKPRKEKKRGGFAGKLFATLALGILFGLAAGATFLLFNRVTGASDVIGITDEGQDKAIVEEATKPADSKVPEADVSKEISDNGGHVGSYAMLTDVSKIVDDAMPSIVSISGKYVITSQGFWGQTYSQEASGSGSGIIIGQDEGKLYIATNNHVVENSEELSVQFIDGETAEAVIKGTDADVDLAVVVVDIDDLKESTRSEIKVAKLGDSDSIKIGEPAIVIGNSLGFGQTVTSGVISAVDRSLKMSDGTESNGLIQTDAAINQGNSGGALLNMNGEVIGISSSKMGGAAVDGVGFAIPITSAQPILSDIVTSAERVKLSDNKQGYLGIGGQTVTEEVSQMYGLPVGVLVRQVYEDTGAFDSGLQQGDVITKVAGKKVESMEDLRGELQYHEKNEVVEVEISRLENGEYSDMTVEVRLVEKDALK